MRADSPTSMPGRVVRSSCSADDGYECQEYGGPGGTENRGAEEPAFGVECPRRAGDQHERYAAPEQIGAAGDRSRVFRHGMPAVLSAAVLLAAVLVGGGAGSAVTSWSSAKTRVLESRAIAQRCGGVQVRPRVSAGRR